MGSRGRPQVVDRPECQPVERHVPMLTGRARLASRFARVVPDTNPFALFQFVFRRQEFGIAIALVSVRVVLGKRTQGGTNESRRD
jgi:hypothetical protein